MTQEEFDKQEFSAKTKIKYKGKIRKLIGVDFDDHDLQIEMPNGDWIWRHRSVIEIINYKEENQ